MSTYCRVVQLLESDPATALQVTDNGTSLAIEEGGALALTSGVSEYDILFAQTKASADYDFVESDVENEVDGDPLMIAPVMMERTTTGFHLALDANPDSSHYIFRWRVRINSV